MEKEKIKTIPAGQFLRESGLLFQINRDILHPIGLAMQVTIDDENVAHLDNRLWDYREDKEGILYSEEVLFSGEEKLKEFYDAFGKTKIKERLDTLGYVRQTMDFLDDTESTFFEDFSSALLWLKEGQKVTRKGWNGKDMYIFMIGVEGSNDYWTYTNGKNDNYPLIPFFAVKTSDNKVAPWQPSQVDLIANDYYIV